MTSVVASQTSRDGLIAPSEPEAPRIVTMEIKLEGGQVKKEEFIFGALLGVVRSWNLGCIFGRRWTPVFFASL